MLKMCNEVEFCDPELICINGILKQDVDPQRIGSSCFSLFENAINSFIYCQTIFENDIPTDFLFLEVNPAFEKLAGMKCVVGCQAKDVFPENKVLICICNSVALTGESQKFEFYYGFLKTWLSVSVNVVSKGYFIAIFEDITVRKHTEQALLISVSHLKTLNSRRLKLFSIIAHDLISPFSAIIGYSGILVQCVRENNLEDLKNYASIIQEAAIQHADLLKNMLDWSLSQTGAVEPEIESLEIATLIAEVKNYLKDAASQKAITITSESVESTSIDADKLMINTVLRNLISNAIKFTDKGGKIIISSETSQNMLTITVKDNGIGIDKNRIAKLFQIDGVKSTRGTENERGTGLGLLLCKEFVEMHGGRIWVESKVRNGSSFKFTLPLSFDDNICDICTNTKT